MWKAITRAVSPTMNECELSYIDRVEIDIEKANAQHGAYEDCLRAMGMDVTALPAEPGMPDSVFVEDPAILLDEIAVITRPGAASRRAEGETLAAALAHVRPLARITAPATLEGGDVMRIDKTLYVGASARSNAEGVKQLAEILRPFDYTVKSVNVRGCLHLKSGCTYLGEGMVLANRDWIDAAALEGLTIVEVARDEPHAANVLTLDGAALMPDCFPHTAAIVESLGWKVRTVDISELRKAEAGVTCSSLIFRRVAS
jgi:dimethylargininase